jgi:hypothetical protein
MSNEKENAREAVVFSESINTLNNILLYTLCARVFSDREIDNIVHIWRTNVSGLATILQDEEKTNNIIQAAESHVRDMLNRVKPPDSENSEKA